MQGRNTAFLVAAALAFALPFCVYLATMSPTLNFWDCGEFITTSYILGIPHPPATPMYILVGRLAGLLPLGLGVAHKINMMSALFGALASMMMYLLVRKVLRVTQGDESRSEWLAGAAGLAAALFIAFSGTYWINAIEAEVYSLSAFLMGLTLWLILDWSEHARHPRGNALVYLILYLLSLGVGFHLGTILIFPGFFVLALAIRKKNFSDMELWAVGAALALFLGSAIMHMPDKIMVVGLVVILGYAVFNAMKGRMFVLYSLGLFVLGLSVHLFLLIRAGQHPVINEADPSTWANLWEVLKREQYPFQLPTERKAALSWQFMHFLRYFWEQFRMPPEWRWGSLHLGRALTALPIGLGLLGVWSLWKRSRRYWIPLVTILVVNTIGLIFFLNFSDAEVRERDYFYAGGFYFFALFIGIGAAAALDSLRGEKRGGLLVKIAAPLLVLASLGPMVYHWHTHDRSDNYIARDYAYNMLAPLAENAVIFTNGDNDTFPLWYIQEVEGFRKDVRVVNLSLLNTNWYMKQLRDYEPRLSIEMTDAEIDEAASHYYRLDDGSILQPRDELINHLFISTQRKGWESRPYYFAVTVPRETLEPFMSYLSMEGMVYRMTLKKGEDQVNVARLRENLERNFEWRGIYAVGSTLMSEPWSEASPGSTILDIVPPPLSPDLRLPEFYKDETTVHLIQNYAAAWSRLSIEFDKGGPGRDPDSEQAVRAMEMARLIREDLAPVVLYLGWLYTKNNEPERAVETYEHYLELEPDNYNVWARYAHACEAAGERQKVVSALSRVIELNRDYEPAYVSLADYIIAYFPSEKNVMAVKRQLEEFLLRHPDSQPVRSRLEMILDAMDGEMKGPEGSP